jgi:hypothetical protein
MKTDADPPRPTVASFAFTCRGARSVCLATFFNEWPPLAVRSPRPPWRDRAVPRAPLVRTLTRLSEVTPSHWRCDALLPPGWCEYLFLVDGEWMLDPGAAETCHDGDGELSSVKWIPPAALLKVILATPPRVAVRRRADARRKSAA